MVIHHAAGLHGGIDRDRPDEGEAQFPQFTRACPGGECLRRMVSQDSPDWNASSDRRSNMPASLRTGLPHSWSW